MGRIRKGLKNTFDGFVKFAARGNMFELAVGVVIGSAFTAIINSFVGDIITPLLSPIVGRMDYSNLYFAMDGKQYASLEEATASGVALLKYGKFISLLINFIIVAAALFFLIRGINALKREKPAPAPTTKPCPYCKTQIHLEATRCPNCTSVLEETQTA